MILRCVPQLVEEVWGDEEFGKYYGVDKKIGEVWLCSGLPQMMTDLVDENGKVYQWEEVKKFWDFDRFPFLIKHIKTSDWLSVQVHPDDAFAKKVGEPWGKPEMWYFIKGGRLVNGLKRGALQRLKNGDRDWNSLLNFVKVKAGQAMYIKTGTVHAIGPEIELYEFQMTSDVTYRFYDWGRGRQTHFDQAMQVVKERVAQPFDFLKFSSSHFEVRLLDNKSSCEKRSVCLFSKSSFGGRIFEKPVAYLFTENCKINHEGLAFQMKLP